MGIISGSITQTVKLPPEAWNINGMMFDAWLRLMHSSELVPTQHPVETGASITDHCYVNPRRWSFDLGVSNVNTTPKFSGTASRNVNAYNALVAMQRSRELLTLNCKYGSYSNVQIDSIESQDDFQTQETLKVTVNLVEFIIVDIKTVKVSKNPHATDKTIRGKVSPQAALGTWERVVEEWNKLWR